MQKLKYLSLLFLLSLLSLSFSAAHAQESTTFILIRHAEKVDDGTKDPALSEQGKQRALKLAGHLKETEITAIYSTPYNRTRETVKMLAQQKNIVVENYKPFSDDTLHQILKQHKGGIILIAGHSNTTPYLVNTLIGKEQFSQLDESEYDHLFIVTLTEIGQGKLVHLTY